jgi:hypothetical protein
MYDHRRRYRSWKNNTIVDQSCMKVTRIFKYYCIRSRISICVICMKNRVSHFANQRKTFNRISFRDEWTKRDRQSKNETLFTQLLQLLIKRLIEVIIDDKIRFKCHYICVHKIIRLFSKLWIQIKNELRFNWHRRYNQKANFNQKSV